MIRRVEVASLDDVRAALAGDQPVILDSPPAAAGWQGIGWWLELVKAAEAIAPDRLAGAVLDCGSAPGLALAALRAGCRGVRVVAAEPVWSALQEIAAALGGAVVGGPLSAPVRGEAPDLLDFD